PDAEALINIRPDKIIATGFASVGDPDQLGTVAVDQYLDGQLVIDIPLELILSGDSRIEAGTEKVEGDLPKELQRAVLYTQIDNPFDFGTQIEVLISPDTLNFSGQGSQAPDTLITLDLIPGQSQLDSIVLDQQRIDWLADTTYLKPVIYLLGNTDGSGNPLPSHFLSTDSLQIQLYGKIKALVDTEGGEN
ncbi:MAG: hypothetical protein ACE5D1_06810, partial [Fidelibacterota bacterium]